MRLYKFLLFWASLKTWFEVGRLSFIWNFLKNERRFQWQLKKLQNSWLSSFARPAFLTYAPRSAAFIHICFTTSIFQLQDISGIDFWRKRDFFLQMESNGNCFLYSKCLFKTWECCFWRVCIALFVSERLRQALSGGSVHTYLDMYKVTSQNHRLTQFLGGSIPLSVRHKHNSCLLFAPVGSCHQRTQWI